MSRWVPYFLMMVSMNCWVVGLLPSRRMLLWNSGMRGTGWRTRSLLSMAVFLTFQRANSLDRKNEQHSSAFICSISQRPLIHPMQVSLQDERVSTVTLYAVFAVGAPSAYFHIVSHHVPKLGWNSHYSPGSWGTHDLPSFTSQVLDWQLCPQLYNCFLYLLCDTLL